MFSHMYIYIDKFCFWTELSLINLWNVNSISFWYSNTQIDYEQIFQDYNFFTNQLASLPKITTHKITFNRVAIQLIKLFLLPTDIWCSVKTWQERCFITGAKISPSIYCYSPFRIKDDPNKEENGSWSPHIDGALLVTVTGYANPEYLSQEEGYKKNNSGSLMFRIKVIFLIP